MSTAFENKKPELEDDQAMIHTGMKSEGSKVERTRFYEATPFTVKSLAINLGFFPQDAEVKFGNREYPSLEVLSWRGSYESSTLGRNSEVPVTTEDVVAALEWHIGKLQVGYKGGYYQIAEDSPLWAEFDYGTCNYYFVSGIRYDPETNVVWILTARDYQDRY